MCLTRRSLFGPDGIVLRGALEARGPCLQGAYPSRGMEWTLLVCKPNDQCLIDAGNVNITQTDTDTDTDTMT